MSNLSKYQRQIVKEMQEDGAIIFSEWDEKFWLLNRTIEYGQRGIRPSTIEVLKRKGVIEPNKPFFKNGTREYILSESYTRN